jgi:hypothetical protein
MWGKWTLCWVPEKELVQRLRLGLSNGSNKVGVSFPSYEDSNRQTFSETLCFLFILNSERETKPINPMILGVIHHRGPFRFYSIRVFRNIYFAHHWHITAFFISIFYVKCFYPQQTHRITKILKLISSQDFQLILHVLSLRLYPT